MDDGAGGFGKYFMKNYQLRNQGSLKSNGEVNPQIECRVTKLN